MTLFDFEDVVVRFGDTIVLDRVDASIEDRGSITCLLGPSGAGKSTLLRLCNRLEVPVAGAVRFRGEDVSGLDPRRLRRRVGMVFQRPTLFPGTVRQNLAVAEPDGTDDVFAEALERARLDATFLDRVGDSLSGGEAQRACLARTLVTRPEVLLMDEPTSALDPSATRGLEELAVTLATEGLPVLWVTHDLDQADRIADAQIVLVGGRIASDHEREHYFAAEDAFHHHHPSAIDADSESDGVETHPGPAHADDEDDD